VCLDRKEFIHPHKLGNGLKLWEQGASELGVCSAIHAALACSNGRGGGDYIDHPWVGRWAGTRIAVIGDYAEPDDLAGTGFNAEHVYSACSYDSLEEAKAEFTDDEEYAARFGDLDPGEWKDVSDEALDFLLQQYDLMVKDNTGWRTIVPKPGSLFDSERNSEPAMAPDLIIGSDG